MILSAAWVRIRILRKSERRVRFLCRVFSQYLTTTHWALLWPVVHVRDCAITVFRLLTLRCLLMHIECLILIRSKHQFIVYNFLLYSPSVSPIGTGWQHIRQFCALENCDHLQLVYNRRDHHDISAIARPKPAKCRNRPKLNYRGNWLEATFSPIFSFCSIRFFRFPNVVFDGGVLLLLLLHFNVCVYCSASILNFSDTELTLTHAYTAASTCMLHSF